MDKKYFTVYKMTIPTCPKGNIWGITSFRMGLNELLKESNLKKSIIEIDNTVECTEVGKGFEPL